MRKNIFPLVLALAGGGVGFALRKWQLATGFEPDTALAIPGATSALALMGFSLFMLLLFLPFSRKVAKRLSWETAYAAGRQNNLAVVLLILAAMLLLTSAGLDVLNSSVNGLTATGETAIARAVSAALPPLRMFLCAIALPAVFFWARAITRGEGGNESVAVLVPCLVYCVWLISVYQLRSSDPVVQDYLYDVLAIVLSLLGLYFIAGPSFENGKPRLAVYFSLAGIYFSLVTLADAHAMEDIFRHLFAVIYLAVHVALILNHPPVETTPAEAETEADNNAQ